MQIHMGGREWMLAVSIASGSSVICGGLVEEVIGSDSIDRSRTSTSTLVKDCLLRISFIGGGLSGWCV